MRMAQRPLRRGQKSRTVSVSSPVKGWNARDPIAEMDPAFAIQLDNWFCTPFDVTVRQGSSNWSTGMPSSVDTIASYSPPSGNLILFAASGANIYNVTNPGVVGAPVVTGKNSSQWQFENFGTPGGNFLYMVNGVDAPIMFDGTTWSVPAITGVTPQNLINVSAAKARLWFIEKNTLKAWYLPVLSIAGAASAIDFSGLVDLGGYLVSMQSWTLDAGYGMDDYVAFVTSEGQVLIYKGTDPSSASTWALIGIYTLGSPIGRRCMQKYAGDVILISRDGLAPLSKSLMSSRVNSKETLTDNIQHVVSNYVTSYAANFGWECCLFPDENMLILNVPSDSTHSYQLVMNTISGAWSRFTDWNARTIQLHGDKIFFGTSDGRVLQAWSTFSDNGVAISFEAQQAFNYFGRHTQIKHLKMLRPILSTDGSPALLLGVNTDYDTSSPSGTPSFSPTAIALWDVATWDDYAWGGDLQIKKDWQTASALGFCMAAHLKGSTQDIRLRWSATDYLIEDGGVL